MGIDTSFMVCQGDYKYICVTGHAPQLYNLAVDPKEWNNLAGLPEYAEIEAQLHAALTANFNPVEIEQELLDSLARRKMIGDAMKATDNTTWDYQPFFDAAKQYWREG